MSTSFEYKDDPTFKPWGPFISPGYHNESITTADIIIASIVFGGTLINAILAVYLAWGQSAASRSPLRSIYVWLIWLELLVSFLMAVECFLHLNKIIKPSFAFYFTILFWWCIQVQLLLQIIINRIRVIVPDRRKSKQIMVGTAVIVTCINVSVFCIWIPARLQVSKTYHLVNEIWDRIEKVLYLIIDALLNWYFLKVVKANLINNGLQKYNKLLRFNQRIIIVSLLMDVMIIAAMSIPNSFVYIQFHPLAYLVKLNIEMTMANLIKRIAISTSRRTGNASLANEFASLSTSGKYNSSNPTSNMPSSGGRRRASIIELSSQISNIGHKHERHGSRTVSFAPTGNQIKKTEEIHISSAPNPDYINNGTDWSDNGKVDMLRVTEHEVVKSKSMDDVTEGGESVKSEGRRESSSDDETMLVMQGKGGWGRLP